MYIFNIWIDGVRVFLVFRDFTPFSGDLGEYSFFWTCIYFIIMRVHFLLYYHRFIFNNYLAFNLWCLFMQVSIYVI